MHATSLNAKLNLVVALACEARPIIDYYHLKKIFQENPFTIFTNQNKTLNLIISGIGKTKAAMATIYLHLLTGNDAHAVYLNLGIVGSNKYLLGDLVAVNKITDDNTQTSWYPNTSLIGATHHDQLISYDVPQTQYVSALIDMEASGFFQAASLLVTQEQIQVIKIISDVDDSSRAQIKPALVEALIKAKMRDIANIMEDLLVLSAAEYFPDRENEWLQEFKNQWHFTVYETHELRELLRKWAVHRQQTNPIELCKVANSSRKVLQQLIHHLEHYAYGIY